MSPLLLLPMALLSLYVAPPLPRHPSLRNASPKLVAAPIEVNEDRVATIRVLQELEQEVLPEFDRLMEELETVMMAAQALENKAKLAAPAAVDTPAVNQVERFTTFVTLVAETAALLATNTWLKFVIAVQKVSGSAATRGLSTVTAAARAVVQVPQLVMSSIRAQPLLLAPALLMMLSALPLPWKVLAVQPPGALFAASTWAENALFLPLEVMGLFTVKALVTLTSVLA
eukprot:CAMPEP_0115850926 /NCGR_PEP_ID=MMETSP0287-20121206/12215_1 /TAXON_ID=412157 /ORGANISM="Chrysochromulina rotalis, Strain UIO044" /LENGTH=228 /DNA_ID=CAMNT_0003304937 /DNA_START=125 /DNA_END=811 /DNA_ORIENTATION=-